MSEPNRIQVGDRVAIYQRGKKATWCADFWNQHEHQRVSLKTRNKKIAIKRAVALDHQLATGTFTRPCGAVKISAANSDYLTHLATEGRAPKTLSRYRGELRVFTEYCQEQRVTYLSQISPMIFDRFRAMRKQTHSLRTLYHEGVVIKQFLKWCRTRRLITENPLVDCRLAKPPLVPQPSPSLREVQQILENTTPRRRLLIAVLAFTGMRSGELQRLRIEDVDLLHNCFHVVSRRGLETKTRLSRRVPIHPVLKKLLLELPKSTGPWFVTSEPSDKYPEGGHWVSTKHLNEDFQQSATHLRMKVGRKAGGYTIHSLRHFFETFCVNGGIPQRVVDAWLGHSADRSMAAVYYSLSDEDSQMFMLRVPFGTSVPAATAG